MEIVYLNCSNDEFKQYGFSNDKYLLPINERSYLIDLVLSPVKGKNFKLIIFGPVSDKLKDYLTEYYRVANRKMLIEYTDIEKIDYTVVDYFNIYNNNFPFLLFDINRYDKLKKCNYFYFLHNSSNKRLTNCLLINIYNREIIVNKYNQEIVIPNNDIYLVVKDIYCDNFNFSDYFRGWLIGNFSPALKKTSEFELGILYHKKDEKWPFHYHQYMQEINILLQGKMLINNIEVKAGNFFVFDRYQISCPFFLEDCYILCIKLPSVPNDKIVI